MIENILKLRDGKRISRNEYAATKQKFEDLYKDADSDTRAKVDGLLMSGNNYSSANPMNNRSAREFSTNLYNHAINMLENPGLDYSVAPNPSVSTANLFNGYSHAENSNNADYVAYKYLTHNKKNAKTFSPGASSSSTSATGSTPTISGTKYYRYNWADGIPWTRETDTLELRTTSFAEALKSNIESALNSGKNIVGADKNKLQLALNMFDGWNGDFGQLMRIAQLANVDKSQFEDYFGELYPGMSKIDKAKKVLTDADYIFDQEGKSYGKDLDDIIRKNNYKVASKNGTTYLIKGDYSGVVTDAPKAFVDTNYLNTDTYNKGYVINSDGSFISGDLSTILDDLDHPFFATLNNFVTKQGNDERFHYITTPFHHLDKSNSDVVNYYANDFHGKSIADVSRYFGGKDVIATSKNNDFKGKIDKYHNLNLTDKDITLHVKGDDGKYYSGSYELLKNILGDIDFTYTGGRYGSTNLTSYKSLIPGLPTLIDITLDINEDANINRNLYNPWSDKQFVQSNRDIVGDSNTNKENTARFFIWLYANQSDPISAYKEANPDANKYELELIGETRTEWFDQDPELKKQLIGWILHLYDENPNMIKGDHEREYMEALRDMMYRYPDIADAVLEDTTQTTPVKKQGGIIKAASGTQLDINGNPIGNGQKVGSQTAAVRDRYNRMHKLENDLLNRATELGRSKVQQRAIETNEWTGSDTTRAIALAGDISGLIAAIAAPGAGSLYAVGEGVVSTFMDLGADLADDRVSTGQAWKNFGINAGLTAGAMFGAKAPKIIKGLTRLVPKAMTYIGTAGIVLDPEIQKSVSKVIEGKSLNVNDWRNISIALRTAVGLGTVATTRIQSSKGAKNYKKLVDENIEKLTANSELEKGYKYALTNDGKENIKIKESVFNKAAEELKAGKLEEAKKTLTLSADNPDGIESSKVDQIIHSLTGEKSWGSKLKFWNRSEHEKTNFLKEGKLAIISEARLDAINQIRNKYGNSSELVERFNPYLNAALADVNGRQYSSIRELEAAERKNIPSKPKNQPVELRSSETQSPMESSLSKNNVDTQLELFDEVGYSSVRKKLSNDVDIPIKPNTKVKSFTDIADVERANRLALSNRRNIKELSIDKVRALFNKNQSSKIRGGAWDETKKELVIWQQGGKINEKYSHLR